MDEPVAPSRPSAWSRGLKLAVAGVVGGLIAVLVWATLAAGRGRGLVAEIAAGERPAAPGFELEIVWPRLDTWPAELSGAVADQMLSLDELRGYTVVLNFWASWCIPCREEAPILAASTRTHSGEVLFLGVDVQDLRGDGLAFLREFDVPFVSVRDGANETFEAYGLTGVPETYFVDASGHIVAHVPGAVSRASLERGVAAIASDG